MTDHDLRVEGDTLVVSPMLRAALIEAAREERQAKLTDADADVITDGFTRERLETDFGITLPDDFTPVALFPGVNSYPDTDEYAGKTGTCVVAYGGDSYLFDLTCEAQGYFTGNTIDGHPAFVDVQTWHDEL